ncbi:MAG: signal peptidase II [Bacilli bacterium]|nr:signal peptidase II [Bacilli bacterium]
MISIFLIGILFLLIDIISKQLVLYFMVENQTIQIIPHFFSLTYVKNTGVAFSMLEGNILFILLMSVIVVGVLVYFAKSKGNGRLEKICYSMILGGALGNFLDRIFYGYVIDFFDFTLFGFKMAIFNVADVLIVCGVFLLIVLEILKERKML